MKEERERLRTSFKLVKDKETDLNIHLKDRLISVSTQMTNHSKKKLVRKMSIINAILNKRFVHRKFHKRPDRIMFYSFFEKSKDKKLLHSHNILRVPKFIMRNYEKLREFFRYFKHIVVNKFFMTYKNYKRDKRDIATRYSSKEFSNENDNFFVF